ncbi:hypothetical protein [Myroides fluvii]|uniref:hypothetical protein n=1 Tax=Myroides fluvii TaxID=2572594 RepID=UPI00131DC697|nr:hypothetical protein [Myroides fluvii]
MKAIKITVVLALSVFAIACGEKQKEGNQQAEAALEQVKEEMNQNRGEPVAPSAKYKKGAVVPKELVCMVNDAFMGKEQLKVEHEGKVYYGCCAMCQSRIPEDETVRLAKDPFTLETVDKAEAYIVMIGDNGEVAYFKNEANYQQFVAEAQVN